MNWRDFYIMIQKWSGGLKERIMGKYGNLRLFDQEMITYDQVIRETCESCVKRAELRISKLRLEELS